MNEQQFVLLSFRNDKLRLFYVAILSIGAAVLNVCGLGNIAAHSSPMPMPDAGFHDMACGL